MSDEEKAEIERLYCRGVKLREEAKQLTVRALAKRFDRHPNTILVITNGLDPFECAGVED